MLGLIQHPQQDISLKVSSSGRPGTSSSMGASSKETVLLGDILMHIRVFPQGYLCTNPQRTSKIATKLKNQLFESLEISNDVVFGEK